MKWTSENPEINLWKFWNQPVKFLKSTCENLKLTKEIREINVKLSDEKKKKPSATTTSYGKNDKHINKEYLVIRVIIVVG